MPAPGPTALVDVVDERNEPVDVAPRAEVFSRGVNFRTVHVLVFSSRGEVLLQKLASGRERNPGRWGTSVAGYLFAGESYESAARRRAGEELGVSTPLRNLGVLQMLDRGVTKFVGIYSTVDDHPHVLLPEHVARIEFRPWHVVQDDLIASPDQFTESFRAVVTYVDQIAHG